MAPFDPLDCQGEPAARRPRLLRGFEACQRRERASDSRREVFVGFVFHVQGDLLDPQHLSACAELLLTISPNVCDDDRSSNTASQHVIAERASAENLEYRRIDSTPSSMTVGEEATGPGGDNPQRRQGGSLVLIHPQLIPASSRRPWAPSFAADATAGALGGRAVAFLVLMARGEVTGLRQPQGDEAPIAVS